MNKVNLQALAKSDKLIIKQKVETFEVAFGNEFQNRYSVRNGAGEKLFYAYEISCFCARHCCGNRRPYTMIITDTSDNEVIHLYRPLKCQSCCFPCCLQQMEVYVPLTNFVGYIYQRWKFWYPSFVVEVPDDDIVLRIEGPCCTTNCCRQSVVFRVLSGDGEYKIGEITKGWTGFLRETLSDADTFGVKFSSDLDVNMKAVILGACFLFDYMYFGSSDSSDINDI